MVEAGAIFLECRSVEEEDEEEDDWMLFDKTERMVESCMLEGIVSLVNVTAPCGRNKDN